MLSDSTSPARPSLTHQDVTNFLVMHIPHSLLHCPAPLGFQPPHIIFRWSTALGTTLGNPTHSPAPPPALTSWYKFSLFRSTPNNNKKLWKNLASNSSSRGPEQYPSQLPSHPLCRQIEPPFFVRAILHPFPHPLRSARKHTQRANTISVPTHTHEHTHTHTQIAELP